MPRLRAEQQDQTGLSLTVTGRFQLGPDIPGVSGFGEWSLFTWDNGGMIQRGAHLHLRHPPWPELFNALDMLAREYSDAPVTLRDEADAIAACCWRYGSYIHVLASGEPYPLFASDPQLSRISDPEMMRINLEFSSGLAAWLADRDTAPGTVNRRVRAALRCLPIPWRDRSKYADVVSDQSEFWGGMRALVLQTPGFTERCSEPLELDRLRLG